MAHEKYILLTGDIANPNRIEKTKEVGYWVATSYLPHGVMNTRLRKHEARKQLTLESGKGFF